MTGLVGSLTGSSAARTATKMLTEPMQRFLKNREQFLKILKAEMSNQNPFEPINNSDFMNQLTSLQTLESTTLMNDALTQLSQMMQLTTASGLIGKHIKAVSSSGSSVEGIVSKVIQDNGKVYLIVSGQKVPVSGVQEILPALTNQ